MFNFDQNIPSFILDKKNTIKHLFYTSLFALIFINFYSPFGVKYWFHISKLQLLFYSSIVILAGMAIVAVSRVLMYFRYRNTGIKYWQYIVWVFAEIFFLALFYSIFQKYYFKDTKSINDILKISIQNTALILLLPYSVLWLYFSYKDKIQKLEEIKEKGITDEERLISFIDEKGILRISVKSDNLLYIEASDNYINIHYLSNGKITHFLVRNSLKNIESLFKNSKIIRCHRSYMVNFSRVRLIRKEKESFIIELDTPETIEIPVSKLYSQNIVNIFMNYTKF